MSEDKPRRRRHVVGVRFRPEGPIAHFDPGPLRLAVGDRVVVETDRGPAIATVATPRRPWLGSRRAPRIVKKADGRDRAREERALALARTLEKTTHERLRRAALPLKLVSADVALDCSRATVFVTGEHRVDTRQLARDLGAVAKTRVDVRQIGARDEARRTGGLGICGRELCCASWLTKFAPVSLKMAKIQDLSPTPSKLAGQCGRLKCCLRYEFHTYQQLQRGLPPIGAEVQSVKGDGKVVGHRLLAQAVILRRHEDGLHVEATLEDLVVPRGDDA